MDIPTESEPEEEAITTSNVGKCFVVDMSDRSESDISFSPPKGLAARLAMGSKERRIHTEQRKTAALAASAGNLISGIEENSNGIKKAEKSQSADRIDEIDEPSLTSVVVKTDKQIEHVFNWQSQRDAGNGQTCIFIAHDNPQVGAAVAERVFSEGPMHVMMEFKEDASGHVCFILGAIVYSGDTEGVEGAVLDNPRGSQFLVITDVIAIRGELNWFPTRVMGEISEIDLDGVKIPGLIGGGGVRSHVDVSTEEKLSSFLRGGSGRVDIILDPSHSSMWYPFFEGKRKIAPQFRSQGVGYIRLGDDMSRFGTAFISLDAGLTYLDHGAGSVVTNSSNPSFAPAARARARKVLKQKPVPFLAQTVTRSRSSSDANSTSTPPKSAPVVVAAGGSAVKASRDVPTTPLASQGKVRSQRMPSASASAGVTVNTSLAAAGVSTSVSAGHGQGQSPTGSTGNSVNSTLAPTPPALTHKKSSSAAPTSALKKGVSNTNMMNETLSPRTPHGEPLIRKGTFSNTKELDEIRSIAHSLKESDQFWSARMELLRQLHEAITNISTLGTSSTSSASSDAHTSTHRANPQVSVYAAASPTPRSMDGTSTVSSMTGTSTGLHAPEFPTHIVTDVIAALIKCITRQKNPHVIRGAVSVVRVIGPHAALATPTGIAWRTLLIETIQLLRVSNKPVSDQARDTLTGIHGLAITVASISSLLDDVFNGPNGKNAGASNTAKVIAWLEGMVKIEAIANVAHLRDAATVCPFDKADCGLLFLRCKHLLSHKEEATRDAAIELSGMFLAYEVIMSPGQSYAGLKELVVAIAKAARLIDETSEPADVTMGDPMSARKLVNTTPFSKSFRALEFVGSPEGGMNVSRSSLIRKASSRRVSAPTMGSPAATAVAAAAASSSPSGGAGGIILGALTGSIIKTVSELESRALKLYEKVMLSATRVLIELMMPVRRGLRKHRASGDSIPNETAYESLHDTLATIDTTDKSTGDLSINKAGPSSAPSRLSASAFPAVVMGSQADLYDSYEDTENDVLREQLPPPERRMSLSPSAPSRRNSAVPSGSAPSTPKWRVSLGGGANKNTLGLLPSPRERDGSGSPSNVVEGTSSADDADDDMILSIERQRLREAINRLEATSEIDVSSAVDRDDRDGGTTSPNAAMRSNSAVFLNDIADDSAVVTDLNEVFDHIDELTSPPKSPASQSRSVNASGTGTPPAKAGSRSRSRSPTTSQAQTPATTTTATTGGGLSTTGQSNGANAASIIDIETQLTARLEASNEGEKDAPLSLANSGTPQSSNAATTTGATSSPIPTAAGNTSVEAQPHHVKFVTSTIEQSIADSAAAAGNCSPAGNSNLNRSRSNSNISIDSGAAAALSASALYITFAHAGAPSGTSSPLATAKTAAASPLTATSAKYVGDRVPANATSTAAAAAMVPLPITPECRTTTANTTPTPVLLADSATILAAGNVDGDDSTSASATSKLPAAASLNGDAAKEAVVSNYSNGGDSAVGDRRAIPAAVAAVSNAVVATGNDDTIIRSTEATTDEATFSTNTATAGAGTGAGAGAAKVDDVANGAKAADSSSSDVSPRKSSSSTTVMPPFTPSTSTTGISNREEGGGGGGEGGSVSRAAASAGAGAGAGASDPTTEKRKRQREVAKLQPQWQEARPALKMIPHNDANWTQFSTVVQASPSFFKELDETSTRAKISKSELLRMMESTPSSASSSSVSASASAAAGIPTATTSGPNNNTNNTNTKEQHFTMVSNVSINTNISTSEKEEGPIPALTPNTPLTTAFNPTTPVNAMEMVPGSKDKNHAAGGYGNGHSENDSEARNNNVEDSSNVTPLTAVPAKSAEGDTCSSEPTTTQLAVNAPATGVGADSTAAALTVEPATSATVASAAENNNKEATAAADVEAVDPARLQALKAQAAGINSVAKVKLTDEAGLKQAERTMKMLQTFHGSVEETAANTATTPAVVMKDLEEQHLHNTRNQPSSALCGGCLPFFGKRK